jgi:hypothetical protein
MHRSATQKTVALSSCEAELNAAVLCVQDTMYQKNMLESIGLKPKGRTPNGPRDRQRGSNRSHQHF